MKLLIISLIISLFALADDIKSLPNQAGNGDIDLAGTALLDSKEIEQVVGAPMEPGYVVVRIKVSPRTLNAIRISADDFTLVSRKDGEKSPALVPSQIAGPADFVLKQGKARSSGGRMHGISIGGFGTGTAVDPGTVDISQGDTKKAPDSPLLKILESKMLPDKETKEPVEGLLYFLLDGKNKAKDLGLLYKGPAGRLAMDFK
ncbi:MAG TPA: hypothetical protein VGQ49_02455 [Bryobacteraceae bacterium]|nr:hypothetical protein [Bryobacteraceae bacterium]